MSIHPLSFRVPGKEILLAAVLTAGAALPALAQISININVAPPQPQYEAVPMLAPHQAWAPGYWAWTGERHVWVAGRPILKRDGYRWAPDRWEQKGNGYQRQPGYWVHDTNYVVVKDKKFKKDKHDKHGEGRGNSHGKGHGKGHKD